jgi:hypothetical protein
MYFDGSAAGSRGYEGTGVLKKHARMSEITDAAKLSFTATGSDQYFIGRAMKLNEATAVTGTGALTGQNHMQAASGDIVFLVSRVIAVSGSGSITVALQESSDDGGGDAYATHTAGTAQTAVGAVVTAAAAGGTLGAWWRCNVTAFSGFSSVTLRTAVGVVKRV